MRNSLQKDLRVKPKRPAVNVREVELHPAIEVELAAALERPKAGQARTHAQAAPLPGLVLFHLFRNRGPWTHERHVSAQDIPDLRQLIEAGAAQPAADGRDPRIGGDLEDRAIGLVEVFYV